MAEKPPLSGGFRFQRVVQPVLEVEAPAAADQAGERGGPHPAVRDVSVERWIVGGLGARPVPAPAPLDRELPFAALVDETWCERSNRRRPLLAVGLDEPVLVAVAAAAGGADEVAREESAGGAPVEAALQRQQRTEGETTQQQERDKLDGRLAALSARWAPGAHRPLSSGQSRTRSSGLMQSLAMRMTSESGITWPGKRLSGCMKA
jgi:hypothetical protein